MNYDGSIAERIKMLSDALKTPHADHETALAFHYFVLELGKAESEEIATALLSTFDDEFDDGGVQEVVLAVLAESDPGVVGVSLCSEIERMAKSSPQWLEVILTDQIRENPSFIENHLQSDKCRSIARRCIG